MCDIAFKGGTEKSGLLCSNPYNSSTRRPTLTCYIPNQWKFNKDFTELYRFEIAALIEEDNLAWLSPLFKIYCGEMENV